jgi:hypothetical protein
MDVKLSLSDEVGYQGARWQLRDSGEDSLGERWLISTVFLAIDHHGGIYETLVNIGNQDDVVDRYPTRVEAVHGHRFYLGLVAFMIKHNAYPVTILDDDGNRVYFSGEETGEDIPQDYDQFWNMKDLYAAVGAPKARYFTTTVCCGATVTHQAPTGRFHAGGFMDVPPHRCSKCGGEISSVYFETFSPGEGV